MINTLLVIIFSMPIILSQDNLLILLDEKDFDENYPVQGTFKATRIVNAQSIELPRKGTMEFIMFHRFGSMTNGFYDLYGLDNAAIRFDFNFGLNDYFSFGFGRSSLKKTYDLYTKIKFLSQRTGSPTPPFSSALFFKTEIMTSEKNEIFSNRLVYDLQLLIARKINSKISLQLIPTVIHKNLIQTNETNNTLFSFGIGGRIKITNRFSINGDTFYPMGKRNKENFRQSWGVGCDIETGGHVFQLMLTNVQGSNESAYIEGANGTLKNMNIYFGFNITRSFTL